jgi:ABC-type multidrug transport system fused ATPase/permease subunit
MKNILKIIKLSKPLYKLVGFISLLIVINSALGVITPLFVKNIVDEIQNSVTNKTGDMNKLIIYIAIAFGTGFLGVIMNVSSERVGDHFAGKLRQISHSQGSPIGRGGPS